MRKLGQSNLGRGLFPSFRNTSCPDLTTLSSSTDLPKWAWWPVGEIVSFICVSDSAFQHVRMNPHNLDP